MAPRQISDDIILASVEILRQYGSLYQAEKATGASRSTLRRHRDMAIQRGLISTSPLIPGFEIVRTTAVLDEDGNTTKQFVTQRPQQDRDGFNIPDGHRVTGGTASLDGNGNVERQWLRFKEGELDPLDLAERLKESFAGFQSPVLPSPAPKKTAAPLINFIPCNDWHINMLAWGREVGENWDLSIAERVIGRAMVDVIKRAPMAQTSIVLGGGDLLHADNNDNRTARSGHALDVDGRHQKGLEVALRIKVLIIDTALARSKRVIVRNLPGNHDDISSVAVTYFLKAYYRNEPRVFVDTDPSLFFWFREGAVLLGATHGHTIKLKDMAQIMAHRKAEDWGKSRYRYVHGFHIHHQSKFVTEGEGVISESHQAPIPQDAWHFASGFLSGRSVQAITYHRDYGEIGRVRSAILDGGKACELSAA